VVGRVANAAPVSGAKPLWSGVGDSASAGALIASAAAPAMSIACLIVFLHGIGRRILIPARLQFTNTLRWQIVPERGIGHRAAYFGPPNRISPLETPDAD